MGCLLLPQRKPKGIPETTLPSIQECIYEILETVAGSIGIISEQNGKQMRSCFVIAQLDFVTLTADGAWGIAQLLGKLR